MTGRHSDRRPGHGARAAVAAVLLFSGWVGAAALQGGASSPVPVSEPAPSATPTAPASSGPAGSTPGVPDVTVTRVPVYTPSRPPAPRPPAVLPHSAPQSLRIPATGTRSELLRLGLRDDGSLQVPPEPPGSPAGWYDGSPTPGQRGPAVLLGHVNATGGGPGVFAELRRLRPGDTVEVARRDGSTAVFRVTRGEAYAKDHFPTLEVYGNTAGAELRLITCDGYDPATGTFGDNYVVYATLVS